MSIREELSEAMEEAIKGGVHYTPDYYGAKCGSCGPNGTVEENYRYDNEDAMNDFIAAHFKDKVWASIAQREEYLINGLLEAGIIYKK